MKAISELAGLWGGLRRSSIWARGLLVHSLASLRQPKWAKLKYKQENPEQNQTGCGAGRHRHAQTEAVAGWWLVLQASGPHRQTTIYGELIRK